MAICKDLGRPYENHQEKLVKLDRQLAAKSQQAGGQQAGGALTQQYDQGGGNAGRNSGGNRPSKKEAPRAEPKASPKKQQALAAPAAKGVDYRGGVEAKAREEEDFEDDDVNDLLV